MQKPQLTPAGVQEVLSTLYALPDPQLLKEASALSNDFRQWLYDHFTVRPAQETFIETQMSEEFVDYVSLRVPFVFMHRLPVSFIVPPPPTNSPNYDEGKIIKARDKTEQGTDSEEEEEGASGSFEFEVFYDDVD